MSTQKVTATHVFANVWEIVPDLSLEEINKILKKNYFLAESEPLRLRLYFLFRHNPECFDDDDLDEILQNLSSAEYLERLIFSRVREKYEGTRFEELENEAFRDWTAKSLLVLLSLYLFVILHFYSVKVGIAKVESNGYKVVNAEGLIESTGIARRYAKHVVSSELDRRLTFPPGDKRYDHEDIKDIKEWSNTPTNISSVIQAIYNDIAPAITSDVVTKNDNKIYADSVTMTYATVQTLTIFCSWYELSDHSLGILSEEMIQKITQISMLNGLKFGFDLFTDIDRVLDLSAEEGQATHGRFIRGIGKIFKPTEFREFVRDTLKNEKTFYNRDLMLTDKGTRDLSVTSHGGVNKAILMLDFTNALTDVVRYPMSFISPKAYKGLNAFNDFLNLVALNVLHVTTLPATDPGIILPSVRNAPRYYTYTQWMLIIPKWVGILTHHVFPNFRGQKRDIVGRGTLFIIDLLSTTIATNKEIRHHLDKKWTRFFDKSSEETKATKLRNLIGGFYNLTSVEFFARSSNIRVIMIKLGLVAGEDIATWISTDPMTVLLVTIFGTSILYYRRNFFWLFKRFSRFFKNMLYGLCRGELKLLTYNWDDRDCVKVSKWSKHYKVNVNSSVYVGDWKAYRSKKL